MSEDSRVVVSVVIPVYKSAKYLRDSMGSVYAQTYRDYEMILVDDGCPDNSHEVIAEEIKRNPDKKILYIRQENKGIAGARNTGIRNSHGKYIALLDADDRWRPTRLVEGVRILDAQPEVGLAHSRAERMSSTGEPLSGTEFPINVAEQSGDIFENLVLRRANIRALTTLFRRQCCDKVGLFNESKMLMGVDDRDLWIRIAREYRVAFVDTPLAYWREHEGNYSSNNDRMLQGRFAMLGGLREQGVIGPVLYRRGASKIYKDMGDVYLFGGKFGEARSQYLKSIRSWPLEAPAYRNCMKALLHRRPTWPGN